MNAAHIAGALLIGSALADAAADPWGFLPPETICKQRWEMANAHVEQLDKLLDFLCGDPVNQEWPGARGRPEDARPAGGNAYRRLNPAIKEAQRYKDFWWALWYVRYPRISFQEQMEWADKARIIFGPEAFRQAYLIPPIPPEQIPFDK